MKHRILSIIAVFAVLFMGLSFSSKAYYSDVDSSGLEDAILSLKSFQIVSGYSDGTFKTENKLTRAEFCKLAVYAMGLQDEIDKYSSLISFSDVSAGHWAIGFINVASEKGILNGYGDGRFGPEENITYAQAATVLLRILGYSAEDIGTMWPGDYIAASERLGISSDFNIAADDTITRGQAFIMLKNMMCSKKADGKSYSSSLGSKQIEDTVILSASARSDSGKTNMLKLYGDGKVSYYSKKSGFDSFEAGMTGTIVLDANGEAIGFLTDDTEYIEYTLSEANASELKTLSGKAITVSSDMTVIYDDVKTSYSSIWYNLKNGSRVNVLYGEDGKAEVLFIYSIKSSEEAAIVLSDFSSGENPFAALLGIENKEYAIYKNSVQATVYDLSKYDTAFYDEDANCLSVSDLKLTGYYERAYPNTANPSSITVMGTDFEVLESAQSTVSKFQLGDTVTFLLTSDYKIAGAFSPSQISQNNLLGVLETYNQNGKSSIVLPCGLELSSRVYNENASQLVGRLVKITSAADGEVRVSEVSYTNAYGAFDTAAKMVGTAALSNDAVIYDSVQGSCVVKIDIDDITQQRVEKSSVKYVSTNSRGEVNLILLDDVTGDAYTYGFIVSTNSDNQNVTTNYTAVKNSSDTDGAINKGKGIIKLQNGTAAGLAVASNQTISGYVKLNQAKYITRADFNEEDSIEIDGYTVKISDDVHVYNSVYDKWVSLEEAKAFSDSFTVYYDKQLGEGGKIRLIEI